MTDARSTPPPPCGLAPEDWRELCAILQRYAPGAEFLAYGSRVNGTAHPGSDLDLAVRNPREPERQTPSFADLRAALEDSGIPILVDAHDWALLPENFRREIATSGIPLPVDAQS